ncbi:pseudouridine synthase [Fusobacterium simiae]|uniref:pseudouridine synthase n=1 Tax=Fusobacterium simiae TaxID=855 RepID=UPI0020C29EB4|nr:pseudouridine synthase [Fusobacterium simiae]MDC7955594.1 pseudouridine synthase [Fusobacterium simiae]
MRLDKFLVECGIGSRKEAKKLISNNEISVNGLNNVLAKDNINENFDIIEYNGKRLQYKEFRYYVMNKKAGYITATEDFREKTVMSLLPEWVIRKDLAPVGRLDKDTEGLLLFTNDGKLNHKLLSPKNHIDKVYYVEIANNILDKDVLKLEQGVDIGNYITQPAKVEKISENKIYLIIKEGKFHQVKKMLEAINNKVCYLKRVSFGKLKLDDLALGEVKEVNLEDII